jgi:hypothetical protein
LAASSLARLLSSSDRLHPKTSAQRVMVITLRHSHLLASLSSCSFLNFS